MKNTISNFKIMTKLMILLVISLIFLIILGISFFIQLTLQENRTVEIYSNRLNNYMTYSEIHNDIMEVQTSLFQMITWVNANYQTARIKEIGDKQKVNIKNVETIIGDFLKSGKSSSEEKQLYGDLFKNFEDYEDWALRVIDMVGVDSAIATMQMGTVNNKFSLLKETVEKLQSLENKISKAKYSSSIQQSLSVLIAIMLIFIITLIAVSLYISRSITEPLKNVVNIIKGIVQYDFTKKVQIISNDEIGEMANCFNLLEEQIKDLLIKIKSSSKVLLNSIQGLSVSSDEIFATAELQATSVKEIVTTMEDSNVISNEMSKSINEVVKIAMQTKNNVETGVSYVKNSLSKMEEIKNKNMDTINGIKQLGEKIENIWDIVNIINGIVNQTKILAFNAALEASSASEGGKNFQIVASEIKRLADNTMVSTKEIKEKINEIQSSSNNLIIISEDGTERIREGWELSQKLEDIFENILRSAEISAESSEDIELSIKQQTSAFQQILLTLKEISKGVENFVVSTKQTSDTTETLKSMADSLNKTIEKYTLEYRI